jgi:hypothetical protein
MPRHDRVARPGGNVPTNTRRCAAVPLPEGVQKHHLEAAGLTTQMSQATYDRTLSQEAYRRDQNPAITAATAAVRVGGKETGRKFY